MNYFSFDIKKICVIALLIALPFLAINTQRKDGEMPWFLVPFSASLGVVNQGYSEFSTGVRRTTAFYLNLLDIKKINLALLKENLELKARMTQFEELSQENQHLNSLLDFKKESKSEILIARVIGIDINADYETIRINKGSQDGLKPFMPVIAPNGVIGYIFRPQTHSSQVLLLSDRNTVVDGQIQRTRAHGLIEGASRDKLRMLYILRADDAAVGDVVTTSGINKIFPRGVPIGKIVSAERDANGISQIIEIKPDVNPYNLDEVLVLKKVAEEPVEPSQ
ncbi:MAG: rod shape-determining protein MreC [Pseudomonadota bacterium]|nr:rod shape-determining protein MreC [Pseudomonadota bacterium]